MLTTHEERLLEELLFICTQANKFTDIIDCAPLIYKFTDKFLRDPLLSKVRECLNEDLQRDFASLAPALRDATNKMWPLYDAIAEFIEYKKIIFPNSVYNPIIFKNRTEISLNCYSAQYNMFVNVVRCFLESSDEEVLEFLKKYARIGFDNNGKRNAEFPIDKSYLENEHDHFARIVLPQDWRKFNVLLDLHTIYNKKTFAEKIEALQKSGFIVSLSVLINMSKVLDEAMNPMVDIKQREKLFNIIYYIDCMYSLYYYAKNKLLFKELPSINQINTNPESSTKSQPQSEIPENKIDMPHKSDTESQLRKPMSKIKSNCIKNKQCLLQWDNEKLCLTIDKQIISHNFKPGKGPVRLLNFITKNGRFPKMVNLNGIYNVVRKSSESSFGGKQEKPARAYIRDLNEIFEAAGYPVPLIVNNKEVTFNSCYKLGL